MFTFSSRVIWAMMALIFLSLTVSLSWGDRGPPQAARTAADAMNKNTFFI